MLCLRRGVVVEVAGGLPSTRTFAEITVEIDLQVRSAIADESFVGECRVGDEVVVNVEAVELGLGSGGSDVVLVNLTRGLNGTADPAKHVMKLNYSPLQHGVEPVEGQQIQLPIKKPVAVFQLHAQLPCIAWAASREQTGVRIGYVQTAGGALPGGYSRTVARLRELDLLCDHITAGPAYGGEGEAVTTIGALHSGLVDRGWDGAVVGPGPGILGSASALGHGGMAALDALHAALALGCQGLLVARASDADPRERHRGISHHTRTVLELLLGEVTVALTPDAPRPQELTRHRVIEVKPDLDGYAESGLPASTMGRLLREDETFFGQALAGGVALARSLARSNLDS